jgi:hypothetical protein
MIIIVTTLLDQDNEQIAARIHSFIMVADSTRIRASPRKEKRIKRRINGLVYYRHFNRTHFVVQISPSAFKYSIFST